MAGTNVFAYDFEADGLYYTVLSEDEKTVEVSADNMTYYPGLTDVVIPENVENGGTTYTVTRIGDNAFFYTSVASVEIPTTVTEIGDFAFSDCSLVTVDIPASVTSMSGNSFGSVVNLMEINVDEANPNYSSVGGVLYSKDGSTLVTWPGGNTNISIPSSVTTIGSYAFYCYYRADEIEIPNTVTTIGDFAFQSSTVERIGVPASVTEIGDGAFSFCSYLTSIDVEASNPVFSSADGVIYNKDKTTLVAWPYAKTDVEIPSSVTKIGDYAFYYCMNISSIDFPSSLTEIGNYAFVMCSGLTSLDFPNTLTTIGIEAFNSCSGLTSVEVPNSVTSLGDFAFYCCYGLESIKLPENLTVMPKYIVGLCSKLKSITIPATVTSIGEGAFHSCQSLTEIEIPASVTSIGNYPMAFCTGLTSVTIPDGVTTLGQAVFRDCSNLETVTIGAGVREMGDYTFGGCPAIKSVTCLSQEVPVVTPDIWQVDESFVADVYSSATLYVPDGTKEDYEASEPWGLFANIEELTGTGINGVVSSDGEVSISVADGSIVVSGASGVEVYSLDGTQVYGGAAGTVSGLPSGVYVVKAGGKTAKVAL